MTTVHHSLPLMLSRHGTMLALIDIQERLANAMPDDIRNQVVRTVMTLVSASRTLDVPTLVTEQYPQGLGPTLSAFRDVMSETTAPIEKLYFSATRAEGFMEKLRDYGARSVILAGMETHICVLQTAMGLKAQGYNVWVAHDAVCSRTKVNHKAGLHFMEGAGIQVVPTETILFMLLEKAGTAEFKAISKLIK